MTFLLNNNVVEVLASNGQPVTGIGNWQNLSNFRTRHTGQPA